METFKKLFYLSLFLIAFKAGAQEQTVFASRLPFIPSHLEVVELPAGGEIKCSNYKDQFKVYKDHEDQAVDKLIQFLNVFIQYNQNWYLELARLEGGQTVRLQPGDLEAIFNGALKLQEAADNFDLTALNLEDLLYSIYNITPDCNQVEGLDDRIIYYNERTFVTFRLMGEYLTEISQSLMAFYRSIVVLEGADISIAKGTFAPLLSYSDNQEGQSGVGEARDLFVKKFTLVYRPELLRIYQEIQ